MFIFIYFLLVCATLTGTEIDLSAKLIGGGIVFIAGSIAIACFIKSNTKNMGDFIKSPNAQSFKNIIYRRKAD
jgi:hypothetical protein